MPVSYLLDSPASRPNFAYIVYTLIAMGVD